MRWTRDDYDDMRSELNRMRDTQEQLEEAQQTLDALVRMLSGIDSDHCNPNGLISSLYDAMGSLDETWDDLDARLEAIEADLANMRARA